MMAARRVKDYLDNGNIVNSVNLPVLTMARAAKNRVCIIAKGADAAAIAAAVPAVASASNTRASMPTTCWTPTPTWTLPPSPPSPASCGSAC